MKPQLVLIPKMTKTTNVFLLLLMLLNALRALSIALCAKLTLFVVFVKLHKLSMTPTRSRPLVPIVGSSKKALCATLKTAPPRSFSLTTSLLLLDAPLALATNSFDELRSIDRHLLDTIQLQTHTQSGLSTKKEQFEFNAIQWHK